MALHDRLICSAEYPKTTHILPLMALKLYELRKNSSHSGESRQPNISTRTLWVSMIGLLISMAIQGIFLASIYDQFGTFCPCVNYEVLAPQVGAVAVFLFSMSFYMDTLETTDLLEFQLVRNTEALGETRYSIGLVCFQQCVVLRLCA